MAFLHAMAACFERYGAEGFRTLFFGVPIILVVFLLSRHVGTPEWVFAAGASLAVGLSRMRASR